MQKAFRLRMNPAAHQAQHDLSEVLEQQAEEIQKLQTRQLWNGCITRGEVADLTFIPCGHTMIAEKKVGKRFFGRRNTGQLPLGQLFPKLLFVNKKYQMTDAPASLLGLVFSCPGAHTEARATGLLVAALACSPDSHTGPLARLRGC